MALHELLCGLAFPTSSTPDLKVNPFLLYISIGARFSLVTKDGEGGRGGVQALAGRGWRSEILNAVTAQCEILASFLRVLDKLIHVVAGSRDVF